MSIEIPWSVTTNFALNNSFIGRLSITVLNLYYYKINTLTAISKWKSETVFDSFSIYAGLTTKNAVPGGFFSNIIDSCSNSK